MAFDPHKHTIKVQGGRLYLPVAARIVWFREEKPDWGIHTEYLEINHEKQYAICQCKIYNPEGRLMSMGTKKEDIKGFGDYIEKCETGSIGRALAMLGYGTAFEPEFDEVKAERFADSPRGGNGFNGPQRPAQGGYQQRPQQSAPRPQAAQSVPSPIRQAQEDRKAAERQYTPRPAAPRGPSPDDELTATLGQG